jgi:ubiquitin C-terminal hydrolase
LSKTDDTRVSFMTLLSDFQKDYGPDETSLVHSKQQQTGELGTETFDRSLPAGLANLRNTCYLNSILQYFYSVNAVRDLVANLDQAQLDQARLQEILTDVDPAQIEPRRTFVGSQCKLPHRMRLV